MPVREREERKEQRPSISEVARAGREARRGLQKVRAPDQKDDAKLASTEAGREIIREASGPLRKILKKGKGALGKVKVPWLSAALFFWTASQEGGDAAAADLIGVDRSVVRNFLEAGKMEIALQPWLLYPPLGEAGPWKVGVEYEFTFPAGGFRLPAGKARLVGIYWRPDGSLVLVFQGRDGSTVPSVVASENQNAHLPLCFPVIDPTDWFELHLQNRRRRSGR